MRPSAARYRSRMQHSNRFGALGRCRITPYEPLLLSTLSRGDALLVGGRI